MLSNLHIGSGVGQRWRKGKGLGRWLALVGFFGGATLAMAADPQPATKPAPPAPAATAKAPVAPAATPAPSTTPSAKEPAAEAQTAPIKLLGDDSYEKRRQAAKELAAQGLSAQKALQAGLQNAELEVRRSCRRLLIQVVEADLHRRLDDLMADDEGKKEHELPCWKRYAEVFGKDKESRQMFADMQRAEPALLESAEMADDLATQVLRLRWQQFFQHMFGNGQPNQPPTFGSLAALVFVAVDTKVKVPQELANNNMCMNVFYQAAFQQALNDSARKVMARKLLGRWIQQPTGQQFQLQKLQLAMQYQVKEALGLGVELLKNNGANNAQMTGYGIEGVARLGGKPYAAMLVPLLKDNRRMPAAGRDDQQQAGEQGGRGPRRGPGVAGGTDRPGPRAVRHARGEAVVREPAAVPAEHVQFFQHGLQGAVEARGRDQEVSGVVEEQPVLRPAAAARDRRPAAACAQRAPGQPVVQQPVKPKEAADPVPVLGLAIADRAQTRKLAEAKRLIDSQSYAEATGLLGEILAAPSDFTFKPDPAVALYRRLKPAAEALLGQLPVEGLEVYELRFGAAARKKLTDATTAGNSASLASVVESFFYTDAGAEAAFLLGTCHRDEGQPLLAAFLFQRLESDSRRAERFQPALSLELAACYLRCRMPKEAKEVLLRLKRADPARTVKVAGKERKLFQSDQQALAWLEGVVGPQPVPPTDWTMFAGSPARSGAGADSNPYLRAKYKVATAADSAVVAGLEKIANENRQVRRAAVPERLPAGGRPDRAPPHCRRPARVDFATGAVRWEAPSEDGLATFLACADGERKSKAADLIERGLRRRLWEDHAFGTLSSDGRSVFGLEGLSFDLGADNQTMTVSPDGRRQLPPGSLTNYNLLCAYDIATGKLKWEAGGAPGAAGNRLAGAFFLGPPLPLDEQLYVTAEIQDQTRLFVLHPATGAVLSEWPLTVREEQSSPSGFFMPWQMNRAAAADRGKPRFRRRRVRLLHRRIPLSGRGPGQWLGPLGL